MDALRTAVSAWGATQQLPWPPTVEQARALTAFSPSALAAFARLRARQGAGRAGSRPRPHRRVPLPAHRGAPRPRHGPRARRVLHRRRGAQLQRLDVHGARHHLDPLGHRVGGGRRDRHDEGPAARRRAVRGRRPARRGRIGRQGRSVDPRNARSRRAADGLRPSRLPRVRSAGGGPAQGGGVDGAQAGLAPAGDRGRGRRAAGPRRASPGAGAQDERRVLRGAGAAGRRSVAGPVPGHVLAVPPRRLDGPRARAGRQQPADPAGRELRRPRGARPARAEPRSPRRATASRGGGTG